MPQRLPHGWAKTTLGDVCVINPAMRFDQDFPDDTEVSFVPMAAVEEESGRLDASETRTLASVRTGYTPFRENDVLFAKITPCMENGKIALATGLKNGLAFGSTELLVFRPFEGLLPRFVLYYLLQPSFRQGAERQMTGAVGQKRVPSSYLLAREFPLPPTAEQARIVKKLDAGLSGLQRAEAATRRAQERLKLYRASVLHDAVTGKLTGAWRAARRKRKESATETGARLLQRFGTDRRARWEEAELRRLRTAGKVPKDDKWKSRYSEATPPNASGLPKQPDDWTWASIDQLAWSSSYGTSVKCTYEASGPAVLRIPNIRNRAVEFEDLKFATDSKAFRPEDFVSPGGRALHADETGSLRPLARSKSRR